MFICTHLKFRKSKFANTKYSIIDTNKCCIYGLNWDFGGLIICHKINNKWKHFKFQLVLCLCIYTINHNGKYRYVFLKLLISIFYFILTIIMIVCSTMNFKNIHKYSKQMILPYNNLKRSKGLGFRIRQFSIEIEQEERYLMFEYSSTRHKLTRIIGHIL